MHSRIAFWMKLCGGRMALLRASFCILFLAGAFPAAAHFKLNLNVRVLHVEHFSDRLRVYLRMPMPYLVADKVGIAKEGTLPEAAPFTTNRMEEGLVVHFADPAQIAADPLGLGRIAEEGFTLTADGRRLAGSVSNVLLHRVGNEPGFATLEEAKSAFAEPRPVLGASDALYVGDSIADIVIDYQTGGPVRAYSISSTLDPGLPDQNMTANLVLDYGDGQPKVFRTRGLMAEPVEISRSVFAAIGTFVVEGVRHILEGLDHVLFVVCLVLGAQTFRALVGRVTGFTIGHSFTLALGFFGYVPSGGWFIPAVETGIALSIIYAAVLALSGRDGADAPERRMFLVTVAIGLLHGLGFSFVLQEILQVTSPDIWQSLLAFNAGVEVGQLFIVILLWPVFRLAQAHAAMVWTAARWGIASACILLSGYWTVERLGQIAAAVS